MRIYSTKSFFNLPTAHCQWFDEDENGLPGDCAALHGYDRSVHFTFSGEIDDQGWIYPFGELKEVKSFLEYYFDHTSLFPANDPRLERIPSYMTETGGILSTIRVLPYGVSMEMSSLFIWLQVNPYIYASTSGRVIVTRVEVREHERNSGFIIVPEEEARYNGANSSEFLVKKPIWEYENPVVFNTLFRN